MPERFLSSDDYDEHAHQLYNEGRFDEALDLLQEGLQLYPNAVELHVGMAYAYLAREDVRLGAAAASSGRSRSTRITRTPSPAMARCCSSWATGRRALAAFDRILSLGFKEDHELMLQVGRALFREGLLAAAQSFFEYAVNAQPDCPEAAACVGYACHRQQRRQRGALLAAAGAADRPAVQRGADLPRQHAVRPERVRSRDAPPAPDRARGSLRRAGIWRYIELKKTLYRLPEDDPELRPWFARLGEVSGEPDPVEATARRGRGHAARRHHAGSRPSSSCSVPCSPSCRRCRSGPHPPACTRLPR